MKKSLFIIAAAAVLASCSNEVLRDDFAKNDIKEAIGFETFVQKAVGSRAEIDEASENNGLKNVNGLEAYHDSFMVWGFKYVTASGSAVFEGEKITSSGTSWTYSPVRYWDKSASSYSFYAAAPYDENAWSFDQDTKKYSYANFSLNGTSLAATTTAPSASASFKDVASGDVDLMISNDITNYTTYVSNTAVNFHFNHILSRLNIGVKVANLASGDACKLLKVLVYNMKCSGTFDEAAETASASGSCARWNTTSGDAFTDGVGYTNASGDALSTTEKYYYQALCIPQTVEYASGDACPLNGNGMGESSAPYLNIQYNLNGENYSYFYNLADIFNGNNETDIDFCEGWMNTLHITISPAVINFDADVYDWNTKHTGNLTVPE